MAGTNYQTTIDFLKQVKAPVLTDTYTPVLHVDLLQVVEEELGFQGYTILSSKINSKEDGSIMLANYTLDAGHPELGMQCAVLNSYNKQKCVTIALGSEVFLCSNGMVSAQYAFKKKHTGSINQLLTEYIKDTIENMHKEHELNLDAMRVLKAKPISKSIYAELVGKMYLEEELLTSTQINIVKKELVASKNFTDMNYWKLYNDCTEALKANHPANYIDSHVDIHNYIMELV